MYMYIPCHIIYYVHLYVSVLEPQPRGSGPGCMGPQVAQMDPRVAVWPQRCTHSPAFAQSLSGTPYF